MERLLYDVRTDLVGIGLAVLQVMVLYQSYQPTAPIGMLRIDEFAYNKR